MHFTLSAPRMNYCMYEWTCLCEHLKPVSTPSRSISDAAVTQRSRVPWQPHQHVGSNVRCPSFGFRGCVQSEAWVPLPGGLGRAGVGTVRRRLPHLVQTPLNAGLTTRCGPEASNIRQRVGQHKRAGVQRRSLLRYLLPLLEMLKLFLGGAWSGGSRWAYGGLVKSMMQ